MSLKTSIKLSSGTAPRSGFTLIELLTVIAIIGILASILIPVVGKVRDSAKNSVCQSNLREWHSTWLMYANDHNGQVPMAQQAVPARPPLGWVEALGEYAGYELDQDPWWFGERDGHPELDTIGSCPADPYKHPHGPNYISYAMNTEPFGTDWTTADPGDSKQRSMERLGDYPHVIIFGDRARNWHMNRNSFDQHPDETYRHNNKANFIGVGGAIYVASGDDPNDPPPWMWDPAEPTNTN